MLDEMQKRGEIADLKCQQTVKLTDAEIKYIADFSFIDPKTGERVFAEAKGFPTPEWKLKKRLWEYYGPGTLMIYQGSEKRIRLTETLTVKKKKEALPHGVP